MVWEPAIFFWVCEKPLSPLGFQNLKLLAKQLSREKKSPHETEHPRETISFCGSVAETNV